MAQQWRGVRLEQVNTTDTSEGEPDVDIIAVHGLDTRSPDTWIWKKRPSDRNDPGVNWLSDPSMLPSKVGRARIFTCDWPADMFEPSDLTRKTNEEFARRLLDGIKRRPRAREDRSILFIASCIGGIILMKALDMANHEYHSIRRATRGIIFLATPFRGTSFQDVATWAEPGLRAWASIRGREVTKLLDSVRESFDLDELVRRFTQLCQDPAHPYQVMTFYELGKTNLYRKVFPWLPVGAKPLVDKSSATLQIVPHPLPLHRCHRLMNKFCGGLGDHDYESVTGKIEEFLQGIRKNEADAWIRENIYTRDRLKIERLSGDKLPMDQCYINLAIVEQPEERSGLSDIAQSSPFSLFARQRVETPDEMDQVDLATIFNQRKGRDGCAIRPRRILIRGRAGVGKTTLCKKMVYEFTHGTQTELYRTWTEIFDRLLWVPLRNLKRRSARVYNHEELFYDEYFFTQGINEGRRLAEELWRAVRDCDSRKSLFLLDGLDEVSQDLSGDGNMARFLKLLLSQPNVIITSRPNASLPADLNALDLQLETIGFYPDQVKAYLDADPNMNPRSDEVQSFLQEHWLIRGLVRIPIQLDALCYSWEDFNSGTKPNTMTGIYKAIEQRLWKKDAVRLGKMSEGDARWAHPPEIERRVDTEIALLEYLAFNGLHSDVIDFTSAHRSEVVKMFTSLDLPLDEALARLSFLRTSDSLSKAEDRDYHFIHLTFQEYFAARYFVRQWKAGKPLDLFLRSRGRTDANAVTDPVMFLRKHKYTTRYDIVWRFVAGLLDGIGQASHFINKIEEEPLDLLGPTHQRLIMHCLSEISTDLPIRKSLERRLSNWLLFEYKLTQTTILAREVEFPEQAIDAAFREGSEDLKGEILLALKNRATIPRSVIKHVPYFLEHRKKHVQHAAIDALGRQGLFQDIADLLEHRDEGVRQVAIDALCYHSNLPEGLLQAVAGRLEDRDKSIRGGALIALCRQSNLPKGLIHAIAGRIEDTDEDKGIRQAVINTLGYRSDLPKGLIQVIASRLEDKDEDKGIRQDTIYTLGYQSNIPKGLLQAIVVQIEDKDEDKDVRQAVIKALSYRLNIPEGFLQALARRVEDKDEDKDVRQAAMKALSYHSNLPEGFLQAIASRVEDKDDDKGVRQYAIHTLGYQSNLPKGYLQLITSRLEDKDEDDSVRKYAIIALRYRSNLPKGILQVIANWLEDKDKDEDVREGIIIALSQYLNLPKRLIYAIAGRIEDTDEDKGVRQAALNALYFRSDLPKGLLQAIASRLEDKDEDKVIQQNAIYTIGCQSNLPEGFLQALASRVEDKDEDKGVRQAAINTLGRQSNLSEGLIQAVASRLEDKDGGVRYAAFGVLRRHGKLNYALLNQTYATYIYGILLQQSFDEQLSWYIDDGDSCINIVDDVMRVSIHDQNDIWAMINEARPVGFPPVDGGGSGLARTTEPYNE